ncbi:hypothetical protein V4V35_18710 [Bacillus infantis]|uniref:hypothetical protein n=1 Tax=Bacillus infantis TaxID=324767 RepID=UPI002FBECE9A
MDVQITEEKLRMLKPIFENILSRKHGKEIEFTTLSMGGVTINKDGINTPEAQLNKG